MRSVMLPVAMLSALLLFGGVVVRADDQPAEAQKPAATDTPARPETGGLEFSMLQRVRTAVDSLELTDDQKAKVDKMFDTAKSELKSARESAAGDRQAIGQKARETFNTLRENLMGLLDDDQKEQLRSKLQSTFRQGGDIVARLRAAVEKLELSDDQKKRIHDAFEDITKQAKDLREKAQGGDADAREKLRMLMQDARKKLGDILTDDQKKKLQEELQSANGERRGSQSNSNQ